MSTSQRVSRARRRGEEGRPSFLLAKDVDESDGAALARPHDASGRRAVSGDDAIPDLAVIEVPAGELGYDGVHSGDMLSI